MIKKVGLIIDDHNQTRQVLDFVEKSKDSDIYQISHLIVQKIPTNNKIIDYLKKWEISKLFASFSFKFISKVEEFYLKRRQKYRGLKFTLISLRFQN